jgi:pyruvate kinase
MTWRRDDPPAGPSPEAILDSLDPVVAGILELEAACAADLAAAAPEHHASLRNLAHYMALRRNDLRGTQGALAALGLSSLGRSESHVLDNLDAVRRALAALAGVPPRPRPPGAVALREGADLLRRNTARLLGPPRPGRDVRIMVTMPSEAATDPALVRELVAEGMDIMRVNCAHDGPEAWAAMVANLRAATPRGDARRVLMDIEGPKLRTGPVTPGAQVVSWNPPRSEVGDLLRPAAVWITRAEAPAAPAGLTPDAVLPLPAAFVDALRPGDEMQFRD